MIVTVVNKRSHHPNTSWYIGRPSALGNPFKIGLDPNRGYMTRADVIRCYDEWLAEQLDNTASNAFQELMRLEAFVRKHGEVALVCWCAPLACHGDVIKRELEERLRRLPAAG